MMIIFALLVVLWLHVIEARNDCGYQNCPQTDDRVNVHVICHSHMDTGWKETYDNYYNNSVAQIYSTVTESLSQNASRRFTVAEVYFFSRWFEQQPISVKLKVYGLLIREQLVFAGGSWTQMDEAVTHYSAVLDNLTIGLKWLKDNFGKCGVPRVGWQLDSFGHSKQVASMFANNQMDGLYFCRIDAQEKTWRRKNKELQFVWETGAESPDMFSSLLYEGYSPPEQFRFESNFYPVSKDNLMQYAAKQFVDYALTAAQSLKTNHVMVPMGVAFAFKNAAVQFENIEHLIEAANEYGIEHNLSVNAFFSNPNCYLKSLHDSNSFWPNFNYDFFPNSQEEEPNLFWTGFYTSRPSLKHFTRTCNQVVQAGKQLNALIVPKVANYNRLGPLREAVALVQHHEAITGTCTQKVAEDFARTLWNSLIPGMQSVGVALISLMRKSTNSTKEFDSLSWCPRLNVSQCIFTERLGIDANQILLTIYNSMSQTTEYFVRLPVSFPDDYLVNNWQGYDVAAQAAPMHEKVATVPGRRSKACFELVFKAILPPLGYTTFKLTKPRQHLNLNALDYSTLTTLSDQITISNDNIVLTASRATGLFHSLTLVQRNLTLRFKQKFYVYVGGHNSDHYVFNPKSAKPLEFNVDKVYVNVIKGHVFEEIHQNFTYFISQVVRIYRESDHIEFDWVVGPVPKNYNGYEIISRFDTNLKDPTDTFYTDANCKEEMKRRRNHRQWPGFKTEQNVSSNYYPVSCWIAIKDVKQDIQMSVLSDRPQGGSSLANGSIELLIQRRTTGGGIFGISDPLDVDGNDGQGAVVRGTHRLVIDSISNSMSKVEKMSKSLVWSPVLFFRRPVGSTLDNFEYSSLSNPLPEGVHILTLEPWGSIGKKVLLRLENTGRSERGGGPVAVTLQDMFKSFNVTAIEEMNLGANQNLDKSKRKRLKWKKKVNYVVMKASTESNGTFSAPFAVSVKPREIRTFVLTVDYL